MRSSRIPVVKLKPEKLSPLFERMNLDRLKNCAETAASAKQVIARSQKLTDRARDLVQYLKAKRRPKR
jgi:hypothetical protein